MRVVRVETAAAYETALAIRREVFVAEQGIDPALEVDAFEPAMAVFLAYGEGELAPAATGRYRLKPPFAKFERIATRRAARGRGLARMLMAAMEADAAARHPRLLPMMHAQLSAATFYDAIGWSRVGPVFQEADVDHVLMIRPTLPSQREGALEAPDLPVAIRDALRSGKV
jgi:predicted GNAT family N-acyltransferase